MHANAETKPASPFVFRFQVVTPVSYQLSADAMVANTGGRGNATARVSLNDGLNTLYQLRDSTEQGRTVTGSLTGVLQPGTRQLVVTAALLTAPGADTSEECISQSGTTTTHVEAYLSFSPAP